MNDKIEQWERRPDLPASHYVDNRIFTDPDIFDEEQESIFAGGWKLICHTSELPENGSYRSIMLGGRPLIIVRGMDGTIRTFFNICPHRGAPLVRDERGTLKNRMQCYYHLWSFDLEGNCTGITRPAPYDNVGLAKKDVPLRPVKTEVFRGLVFVSIKEDVAPLEDFLGPFKDALMLHFPEDEELEVFHFHRSEMKVNWKLWVDNNGEQYHEYLHYLNRTTGLTQPNYHDRRWHINPNGHNVMDQGAIAYGNLGLESRDQNLMPGMEPDALRIMLLFPDVMINIRATVMRIDTITPLSVDRTLVEWRGLGLKSDTPEQREDRICQHNQVWGPAGRNLPEDVDAVESQQVAMASGAYPYSIYAREEELRPQDDSNLRAFYQEWGWRVGRWPHDPYAFRGDEPALNVVGGAAE